jgi:acetyl esterase/lipase
MPPTATNPFDPALFRPDAIPESVRSFNVACKAVSATIPRWWEVGAPKMRQMRATGEGPFPLTPKSPRARTVTLKGKSGNDIALRIVAPDAPKGVYLHIHGGGWTLGSADEQDFILERVATNVGLAVVSVQYRLAPEHPYPAGPDDCEAAALWVVANAKREFGTEILTIGGESGGATLALATLIRLRDLHEFTGFKAANLVYGCFDLALTPSCAAFTEEGLVLNELSTRKFAQAYVPNTDRLREPDISPLYAKLDRLPPALFTIGTLDPLLDDSLFMYGRWIAAGNEAELAIYPGAIHGFTLLPHPQVKEADARMDAFLTAKLG